MQNFASSPPLLRPLQRYIETLAEEFGQIPNERKEVLQKSASVIRQKAQAKEPVKLVFICTHNSRRSHISQLWAQTAAYYYGITQVETYSGGTEATAFNPRAVKAMQKAGFSIQKTGNQPNPTYLVTFAEAAPPLTAFSKVYDAKGNPTNDFIAIMTCAHADENCPFIPGASHRIPVNYNDPKDFDGTAQEEAQYDQRTRQIAREMFYLFSQV
jgi:arsenate reductase (thioredoxin)